MFVTIKAEVEIPDLVCVDCPVCKKSGKPNEQDIRLLMDAEHQPYVKHANGNTEDMILVYYCKCPECDTVFKYVDHYIYSNSDDFE